MKEQGTPIIVCRRANDQPVYENSIRGRGIYCKFCGVELQVTFYGQVQMNRFGKDNCVLTCNPCGFKCVEALTKTGAGNHELHIGPAAVEGMRDVGIDVEAWAREVNAKKDKK
jgi:hypothetical protein